MDEEIQKLLVDFLQGKVIETPLDLSSDQKLQLESMAKTFHCKLTFMKQDKILVSGFENVLYRALIELLEYVWKKHLFLKLV